MLFQTNPPGGTNNINTQTTETPFELMKVWQSIASSSEILTRNIGLSTAAYKDLFDKFDAFETTVGNVAKMFGGSRDMAESIRTNFADALPSIEELGGKLSDIQSIQMGVLKGLQTQTVLNKDSYADLFAVSKLTSDGTKDAGTQAADMTKKFMDAGYGLNNVASEVTKIISTARELGVSSVAVYGQISAVMDRVNLYNFSNGVQGMADMAAKAAALRIDMKSTLDFADRVFDPEKAIEMSANFQRLGVQVSSLLDPYKLMDMARNDPEQLQKSIIEATKSLTYFDEKNQKISILPGAQGQLRELAAATQIPLGELTKMALNAGDLQRKLGEIRFSPEFADDKSREMIANMAQLGEKGTKFEGKYVVDLGAGELKEVSQLDAEDRKKIAKMQEEAGKSAVDLQREANGHLRNIQNALEARKNIVSTQLAANQTLNTALSENAKAAYTILQTPTALNVTGLELNRKGSISPGPAKEKIDEAAGSLITWFQNNKEKIATGDITTISAELMKDLPNLMKSGIVNVRQVAEEAKKQMEINKSKDPNAVVWDLPKLESKIEGWFKKGVTPSVSSAAATAPATVVPTINTPRRTTTTTTPTTNVTPNNVTTGPVSTVNVNINATVNDPHGRVTAQQLQDMLQKAIADQNTLKGVGGNNTRSNIILTSTAGF